jgi:hypothetical protein
MGNFHRRDARGGALWKIAFFGPMMATARPA